MEDRPEQGAQQASQDAPFLRESFNIVETLMNLTYLTNLEAEQPEKVREYMKFSEERLRALLELFYKRK